MGQWLTQLAARDHGRWQPGIGDPSAYGWATVGAYLLAAALCGLAFRAERRTSPPLGRNRLRVLLLATALIMLMLAINKQLDLQSWLTQTGEDLSRKQGWYDHRRAIQQWFVLGIALLGSVGVATGLVMLRGLWSRAGLVWVGLGVTVSFVILRAASFHHADQFFAQYLGPLRINVIFELTGILLVSAGAIQCRLTRDKRQGGGL